MIVGEMWYRTIRTGLWFWLDDPYILTGWYVL